MPNMLKNFERMNRTSFIGVNHEEDSICCPFHEAGGTFELACGGDTPTEDGRHSRSCSSLAGGDCNCGVSPQEYDF